MNMIKAAGLAVVFSALICGGFSIGIECRNICRRIEGLCRLVGFIRSRIECYNEPLSEIYSEFEDEALEACGFLEKLRSDGFSAAVEQCGDSFSDDELLRSLYDFSSRLGKSLSPEQLQNCDAALEYLNMCLKREREKLPQKIKLIKAVSAASAVMTVIVLM